MAIFMVLLWFLLLLKSVYFSSLVGMCFFLSTWHFTFSTQPPWNPQFPRTPDTLDVDGTKPYFFKGISNTLLSYFGCRASRKWLKMVLLLKYQVPQFLAVGSSLVWYCQCLFLAHLLLSTGSGQFPYSLPLPNKPLTHSDLVKKGLY